MATADTVIIGLGNLLRGDDGAIRVGAGTSIQDGAIIHEAYRNALVPMRQHILMSVSKSMLGVLAGYPWRVSLTGDESLCRRPMKRVLRRGNGESRFDYV